MYICDSRARGSSSRAEHEENKAGRDQSMAKVVAEVQRAVSRIKKRWREFRPVCFLLVIACVCQTSPAKLWKVFGNNNHRL